MQRRIIKRAEWSARAPRRKSWITPIWLTLHYNGGPTKLNAKSTIAEEMQFLRNIQTFHMNTKGWADIAYNWAITPSGRIYELRGLKVRSAANGTNLGNRTSYAVYLCIGGDQQPSELMVQSVRWLRGQVPGINKPFRGHRQWKSTACPGEPIMALLKAGQFKGEVDDRGLINPGQPDQPTGPSHSGVYGVGDSGVGVWELQRKLRIGVDGDFGPVTEAAVKGFQISQGIEVDGIAGRQTFQRLANIQPVYFKTTSAYFQGLKLVLDADVPMTTTQKRELTRIWNDAMRVEQPSKQFFSSRSEAATKGFQVGCKLTADGLVGPVTWGTYFSGHLA